MSILQVNRRFDLIDALLYANLVGVRFRVMKSQAVDARSTTS